jgi:hypothetical protein
MSNRRQEIVSAIAARLKTITTANGYNLNIGTKVYDWKLSPVKPSELPLIELRDGVAPIELTDMDGGLSHQLKIEIVIMASGITAATTIRSGLQDISRAMYTDRHFGGLIKSFIPESTNIELQQEENLIAAGQYSCTMVYYSDPGEI